MDLTDKFPKCQSYPPVPNWYSANVTAIVEPHFFLYASRNSVVVLGLNDMKYFNSFTVSNDKVTAIAAHDSFCFTAGVDKTIRVWNTIFGTLIGTYHEHRSDITVLKLIRNGTVSISGDKLGRLVVMDPFGNFKAKGETKVKSEITSISTTVVNDKDYVAVGYANGMIFIEEIAQDLSMTTVYQIAHDNDSIHSLDWQKLSPAHAMYNLEDEVVWPLLAASTKRKRNVIIWTFPSFSKLTTIKLPAAPAQATEQQRSTVWIEVNWSPIQQNKLFLSSYIGKVICYDIVNRSPKLCNNEKLDKHTRNVFTINWFNEGRNCITTSLDKQIIKWDVNKKSCLQILKTQSTFPYSLDIPDWNHSRLAVSMGDNSIKLWNFSNMGSIMKTAKNHDYYDATVLWKGLQGKIEKVKWHPQKEGMLAFGNEYGHVGMYDTLGSKCIPFKSYHKSQRAPYIEWGLDLTDVLDDPDMKDTLLSIGGDGIIHVYDVDQPNALPINLNDRLKKRNIPWFTTLEGTDTYRTIIKIDDTYSYIAIGHVNGLLEVYNLKNLKIIFASNYQHQQIWALDWKNIDGKIYLASGCNEGIVAIHDLSTIDMTALPDVPIAENVPLYVLKGHKKSISDLKWSRHSDKMLLATASFDNFVCVWDVVNQKPLTLFDKHRGRILSVCWNRLDDNILFSGSEDRFIYEWSYLDFPCTHTISTYVSLYDREISKLKQEGNKRKLEEAETSKNIEPSNNNTDSTSKKQKVVKAKKAIGAANLSNSMSACQDSEKSTSRIKREQYCLSLADTLLSGKVKEAVDEVTLQFLTAEHMQDTAVIRYTNVLKEEHSTQEQQRESIHELLYGDKNDVRRLIDIEVDLLNNKETDTTSDITFAVQNNVKSNVDIKLALDIMNAQFKSFTDDSLDANTNSCLTDWIILAMSPMVGKQRWIELMLKQAQKLETIKQFHLAASCYIACTHIYEAVDLYKRHGMFREAIVLAKLRLPPNDPIVPSLFGDWAKELQKGEQDALTATLTATCYLLSNITGSINNAISALARSGKESALFYAACLSFATNEETKEQRIQHWLKKLNERILNKKKKQVEETESTTSSNS